MHKLALIALVGMVGISGTAAADRDAFEFDQSELVDFGQFRDHLLQERSQQLFGIKGPIIQSSTNSVDATTAQADPLSLITVARSLRARVVSAEGNLGANIDMMALWPNDEQPTHLIVCNEQGAAHPGVQRVDIATGAVATLLTGTTSCDPAHRTAWGTVIVGEEAGNSGTLLEIIDPLHTNGVNYNRATGELTGVDAGHIAVRRAVGHLSFEGVALYPNGVMYYSDENRPGKGTAGGAYFKFIPVNQWNGSAPINDLNDSPLANGTVYGLRLGKRSGDTDYGQGNNNGLGSWQLVINSFDADLRAAAAGMKLTGYYRPEDMAIDDKALAEGKVRICANNTGNEENNRNWGETICITDGSLSEATANSALPEVQYLVMGTSDFAMMDNIAYQPGRGNWMIHEDGDAPGFATGAHNNDIWLCLDDGNDVDTLSDGCIRVVTLNDLNAESTGGLFDASGKRYFFSVQHNVTGHGTIVEITGWR